MKVRDLIEHLQQFDKELPVTWRDKEWSRCQDHEIEGWRVALRDCEYWPSSGPADWPSRPATSGPHVSIG